MSGQEERCCECDDPTGKAGKGDGSLYCELCERGPFCESCWDKHWRDCVAEEERFQESNQ